MILFEILGDLLLLPYDYLLVPIYEFYARPLRRRFKRLFPEPRVLARVKSLKRATELRRLKEKVARAQKAADEEANLQDMRFDPFPDNRGHRQAAEQQQGAVGHLSALGMASAGSGLLGMAMRTQQAQDEAARQRNLASQAYDPVQDLMNQRLKHEQRKQYSVQEINYNQIPCDSIHFAKLAVKQGIKNPFPDRKYQVVVQDPATGEWGTVILPPGFRTKPPKK